MRSISLMGEWLRTADIEGALFTTSADRNAALVSVLGNTEGLAVVLISTKASGYNDKTCAVSGRHWVFESHSVEKVEVKLPEAVARAGGGLQHELVELVDGAFVVPGDLVDVDVALTDTELTLSSVKLGDVQTARMFYLRRK